MNPEFPNPVADTSLSREEILRAVALLCTADCAEEEKGAFLSALNQRGESAHELAGFAEALLGDSLPAELQALRPPIERDATHPLVELCGTGGDKAGLLNISTAAMFVTAGAGARVVKHGNRAVSSRCGSADVLEALGVTLHLETRKIPEILERAGCVFLLASDFHPAVAIIAPLRRALAARGQMTIFNLLGPLLNPALPEYQLTGVYQRGMLSRYAEAMRMLGRRKAWAVHGEPPAGPDGGGLNDGGIDELTVTGKSLVVSASGEGMESFEIHPESLGLSLASSYDELRGGDAIENAGRIVKILAGEEKSAARNMIVLNAAAALHLSGRAETLGEGVLRASESIDSGKALASLNQLRKSSER
jgi:anthranilate phosphoribosyltransferase